MPLLWLLALVPFVHTWMLAERYSINAPLSDDWILVGEGLALHKEGKLTWDFFWDPYVSSRSPIPKLYGVGMALLTNWEVKVGIRTTLVLTFAALGAVIFLLRRQRVLHPVEQALMAAAASCLLFTPYQQTQWLINCFPANLMGLTPVIWAFAVWCTDLRVRAKLIISVALGMFASFSFVTGMLVWPLMPLLILGWSPPRFKMRLVNLGLWALAFGATLALYLEGGFRPKQKSLSPMEALPRWPEIVEYVLTFLGGPVAYKWEADDYMKLAPVMSSLFIVALLFLLAWRWRFFFFGDGLKLALPWLGMIGFATATAAMLSLGRLDDPHTTLLNRYQMYSCWFYIGWLGVARLAFLPAAAARPAGEPARRVPAWVWTTAVALPVLALVGFAGLRFHKAYVDGIEKMAYRHFHTTSIVGAVQFMKVCPDHELLTALVWGDPTHVYRIAPIVDAHGLLRPGLLDHPELAKNRLVESGGGSARFEGAVRIAERQASGALEAEGWAIDTTRKTPVPMLVLSIQEPGQEEIILGYNVERERDKPTMKKYKARFMNGRYGWNIRVPGNRVPDGPFRLRSYAYDTKSQEFFRLVGEVEIAARAPGAAPVLEEAPRKERSILPEGGIGLPPPESG
jgi:hypothetical protein